MLALLVRLINLAFLAGNDSFFAEQDAFAYWALGAGLARPESFWPTLVAETDRMPLYPLLLGGIERVFGDAPRMAAILQAVVDAGTCVLIAALGALVSPRVGLIAGILAAFSATLIVFSTQILTETVFLFFFTLMLLAGGCFLRRPSNGLAALAGLAGGLALATRPALAPLLAAGIPLVFVAALVHRRGFAAASVATLLFAVGSAAPVAPVWLRNVIHYGSFSLTAQAGHHLAYWIVPLVTQRADGTPYQTTVDRMETLYRQRAQTMLCAPRKLDCTAEGDLNAQTNPFARAAVKSDLAREAMARLPLAAYAKAWLEGMAVNLGAPALLIDPRVRALPEAELLQHAGREPVGEDARLSVRRSRRLSGPAGRRARRHAADPDPRDRRLCHAGASVAVGRGLRRRRARLFPPAQWAGGNAEISTAHGAGAARAGRDPARADDGTTPAARAGYLMRSRMLT